MHKLILPRGGFQDARHLVNQQTDPDRAKLGWCCLFLSVILSPIRVFKTL